ncbi:MAG: glycosyltransferase, partial [Candidatus Omnitrophica bacterium]|nr:glycosyltransferase [Candidatus Omnitrophota bacterium]
MKVYLPDRSIFQFKQSGIGNAALGVIRAINKIDCDITWHVVDRKDLRGNSNKVFPLEAELKINCEIESFPTRLKKIWPVTLKKALINKRADVIWGLCLEAPIIDKRSVIYIPDLTAIKFPDFTHPAWNNKKRLRCLFNNARKCGAITTNSEYIRRQVIKEFKVSPEKVFNIPLAAYHMPYSTPRPQEKDILNKFNITRPYLLFVGTIEPRKNIARLIDAFELVLEKENFQLVIAGGIGWKANELVRRLGSKTLKSKVIVTGYIEDNELINLYSNARAFVFPSIYEGFGIPLIEAMEFMLPIASSRSLPMPDIAKEAAVYFDPYNTREMAECIIQVMLEEGLRKQLISSGAKRKQKFTWDKTAELTIEVFKHVSRDKPKKLMEPRSIRCPRLADLPAPPEGKKGWPWTSESKKISEKMPGGFLWPQISIVTPTYNQGEFIEETIRSVLLQGYPNLQYIIIDGGSSDETLSIIKKYEKWIYYWETKKDKGQSEAINKGFKRASGDIVAWINSDDLYYPNVFRQVAELMHDGKRIVKPIIYASLNFFKNRYDEPGKTHKALPADFNKLLALWEKGGWLIPQAGVFMKSDIVRRYPLNESLQFAMDYDLWLRISQEEPFFCVKDEIFGAFRIHPRA